jgi:hypothetical protein
MCQRAVAVPCSHPPRWPGSVRTMPSHTRNKKNKKVVASSAIADSRRVIAYANQPRFGSGRDMRQYHTYRLLVILVR